MEHKLFASDHSTTSYSENICQDKRLSIELFDIGRPTKSESKETEELADQLENEKHELEKLLNP